MAKLPDINYRRNLPNLASPKTAALPNKLRNINAAVNTVRGGADTVDKVFENEARLDAGRRYQEVQRDYLTARSELIQDFHSSDRPLESFQAEAAKLRQNTAATASEGISGRANKYLRPELDSFETRATLFEQDTMLKLAESRSKLHIERTADDGAKIAYANPALAQESVALLNASLTNNGLSQTANRAARIQGTTRIASAGIAAHLAKGEIGEARGLYEKNKGQMTDEAQEGLEAAINEQAFVEQEKTNEELASAALLGKTPPDQAMVEARKAVEEAGVGMEPYQVEQQAEAAESDVVYKYMQGLNMTDPQQVLDILDSGAYSKQLDSTQTLNLMNQANSGVTTGTMMVNYERSTLSTSGEDYTNQLSDKPWLLLNDTETQRVDENMTKLLATWTEQGKDPSTSAWGLVNDVKLAREKARVALGVMANPTEAMNQQRKLVAENTAGAGQVADEIDLALTQRSEAMYTDTVSFHRNALGMDIPPLPRDATVPLIQDTGWFDSLVPRATKYGSIVASTETAQSGMLEPLDIMEINQFVKTDPSLDSLLAFSGEISKRLKPADAVSLYNQLDKDDELGLLPTIGRKVAQGQEPIAREIFNGQLLLDGDTYKVDQLAKAEATILEEIGLAYGPYGAAETTQAYQAARALYASRAAGTYNKATAQQAVQDITNGVFDIGGQKFVTPAPGVSREYMTTWLRTMDPGDLPGVVDGQGNAIPGQDIADSLYDGSWSYATRYYMVPAGEPGKYFLADGRGRNAQGSSALGTPGRLLMSADDPSQAAIVDWSKTRNRYPLAPAE